MEGNCQVNNVIHRCDVIRQLPKKVYVGLAEGEWKSRFFNHQVSLKHDIFRQVNTFKLHVALKKCFK